jgi:hypothetical protein
MKKVLFVLCISAGLAACGDGDSTKEVKTDSVTTVSADTTTKMSTTPDTSHMMKDTTKMGKDTTHH